MVTKPARPRWRMLRWDPTRPRVWAEGLRLSYWVLRRTVQVFRENRVQYQANALAYRSLISLVPALAFIFSILALLKGSADVDLEASVREYLFRYLMPESQLVEMILNQLNSFIDRAKAGTYIGFVLLLITAIFLLNAIEQSINQIWKVDQARSLVQRFIIFTAIMIWGPILIGLSLFLTAKVQIHTLIASLSGVPFAAVTPITSQLSQVLLWLHGLLAYLVPFLLIWFSLTIFYITVPNTRVQTRPALFAAAIAGLGWEATKWGFGYWAGSMALSREKIYASLAVFLVFLIWMYLIWIIVLFGVQLNYIIQNFRHVLRVDPRESRPLTDAYLACRVMERIAFHYERGEDLPCLNDLAGRFGVAIPRLRGVISALVNQKILVRISGPEGRNIPQEIYQPNRELNQITLAQVIEAVGGNIYQAVELKGHHRFQPPLPELPSQVDVIFQQVRESNQDLLGQTSLKQIVQAA